LEKTVKTPLCSSIERIGDFFNPNPVQYFHCVIQSDPNPFVLSKSVFFILFAAAEPSPNVCVAYGTLCNDPSVYIATTTQNCGFEFRLRQLRSLTAKPLVASCGTLRGVTKLDGVRSKKQVWRPHVQT